MSESVLLAKLTAMTLERDRLLLLLKAQISVTEELKRIMASKVLDSEEKLSDSPILAPAKEGKITREDAKAAVKEVMVDRYRKGEIINAANHSALAKEMAEGLGKVTLKKEGE